MIRSPLWAASTQQSANFDIISADFYGLLEGIFSIQSLTVHNVSRCIILRNVIASMSMNKTRVDSLRQVIFQSGQLMIFFKHEREELERQKLLEDQKNPRPSRDTAEKEPIKILEPHTEQG